MNLLVSELYKYQNAQCSNKNLNTTFDRYVIRITDSMKQSSSWGDSHSSSDIISITEKTTLRRFGNLWYYTPWHTSTKKEYRWTWCVRKCSDLFKPFAWQTEEAHGKPELEKKLDNKTKGDVCPWINFLLYDALELNKLSLIIRCLTVICKISQSIKSYSSIIWRWNNNLWSVI